MKVEPYILLLSLLYKSCCCLADDGGVASQLVLFKDLPGMDMSLLPVHFNIRSTFKVSPLHPGKFILVCVHFVCVYVCVAFSTYVN